MFCIAKPRHSIRFYFSTERASGDKLIIKKIVSVVFQVCCCCCCGLTTNFRCPIMIKAPPSSLIDRSVYIYIYTLYRYIPGWLVGWSRGRQQLAHQTVADRLFILQSIYEFTAFMYLYWIFQSSIPNSHLDCRMKPLYNFVWLGYF